MTSLLYFMSGLCCVITLLSILLGKEKDEQTYAISAALWAIAAKIGS